MTMDIPADAKPGDIITPDVGGSPARTRDERPALP